MELNLDKELLEADTEEEELSFYEEDHMEKEKYSYYKEDPGDESDDIFANLDGKHGSNSGTDDPGETYGWEAERPIYTEFNWEVAPRSQ